MDYKQAEDYLNSFTNYEHIPGISYARGGYTLEHVQELLARMGNPHLASKTIHITGTKGKGSVAAMISSVLTASGYKTGLYTSPHLLNLRERIQIDGKPISEDEFADTMAEVKPFLESMKEDSRFRQLTYFEALTALAFAYFRKKQTEFQVLEVGLGGRLDATNVVPRPLVSVITSISLDHTQILGSTLKEIAGEKAGIIKPGCWVVLSPQPEEAALVIGNTCKERKANVVQVGKDILWEGTGGNLWHQSLTIQGKTGSYQVDIPLLGDFQLENAATAVAALEVVSLAGFPIPPSAITRGLSQVRWPGRFEILRHEPVVLVDGAHNRQSIKALVNNIRAYFPSRPIFLIFGTSADKDIPGMVEELAPFLSGVIVTRANHPRAASPSALALEFARRGIEPEISNSVAEALSLALSRAEGQKVICATGSLFLVAEALSYFSRS